MQTPVQLRNSAGQAIEAQLVPMTEKHLEDIQELWQDILTATNQPDDGWAWADKLRQSQQSDRHEAYAIQEDDLTHGLLYIETQWRRSQFPRRKRLVYIETLNTAPWNRLELEDQPYLRGVGKAFIWFARQRSQSLGYEGRVGLHAIPGSEGFYRRLKMPEYGEDPEKGGLVYFEYGAT